MISLRSESLRGTIAINTFVTIWLQNEILLVTFQLLKNQKGGNCHLFSLKVIITDY